MKVIKLDLVQPQHQSITRLKVRQKLQQLKNFFLEAMTLATKVRKIFWEHLKLGMSMGLRHFVIVLGELENVRFTNLVQILGEFFGHVLSRVGTQLLVATFSSGQQTINIYVHVREMPAWS